MLRTASIRLNVGPDQAAALAALQAAYAEQAAYADACNRLAPTVVEHRCWNRVDLHHLAYARLSKETLLGAQMVCNAIFKELGRIRKDAPVPAVHFNRASVHFDKRTYSIHGERLSLYTLSERITVPMGLGEHQRRILASGKAKEAELVCRRGRWYFNLVVESDDADPISFGPVMGVDVGENNLAATSTGKVWGGGKLRHKRNGYLALRRRLLFNGSRRARQNKSLAKSGDVSGTSTTKQAKRSLPKRCASGRPRS